MINEMNGNASRCLATVVSSVCSPYTDYPKDKRVKQVHTARTGLERPCNRQSNALVLDEGSLKIFRYMCKLADDIHENIACQKKVKAQ